ncbi:MAG: hypothetical protein ACK4HV_01790, partial [Parachlamydiaceae bacterium]
MVIIAFFLFPLFLFADLVVLLDREVFYENQPITGEIQLTVSAKAKIDENSFKINGKPLAVETISQAKFDGPDAITLYRFRFSL